MEQIISTTIKKGSRAVTVACLAALPLPALSGALQLTEQYAHSPNVGHEQIVQGLYNRPEMPAGNFSGIATEI